MSLLFKEAVLASPDIVASLGDDLGDSFQPAYRSLHVLRNRIRSVKDSPTLANRAP